MFNCNFDFKLFDRIITFLLNFNTQFFIFIFFFTITCFPLHWANSIGIKNIPFKSISPAIVLAILAIWMTKFLNIVRCHCTKMIKQNKVINDIVSLNKREKEFLLDLIEKSERTQYANYEDPIASSLVDKGFLKRGSSGHRLDYPYSIPTSLWRKIGKNKDGIIEKLKGAGNLLS